MAYQQQYDDYRQPRQQQQYYAQGPPQARQAGYNEQYDDYGYDQGQYEQWDNGYDPQYSQQGGWGNEQYQGGYDNMNGQARRPPPQGHGRPPPRDQYGQAQYGQDPGYNDQAYGQPRGQDPRGRPTGPPNGGMRGGMSSNDPRGRRNAPPGPPQPKQGLKPPARDRALMPKNSPTALPQDNAFPTFPSNKPKRPAKAGSIDEAMDLMKLGPAPEDMEVQQPRGAPRGPPPGRGRGQGPPPQGRGPPPARGNGGGFERHDSGHSDGRGQYYPPDQGFGPRRPPPVNTQGNRPPPQRQYEPLSPSQQRFGPNTQRSMTMPQNSSAPNGGAYDDQQQWAEPGTAVGYHGPASPTYIPPRPSTAGGNRQNDSGRPHFDQRPPPMPQAPPQQAQHRDTLDDLYGNYYGGNDAGRNRGQSDASSIDMPNFDAIPDSPRGPGHRRGYSIEDHLSPVNTSPAQQGGYQAFPGQAPPADPRGNFQQQALKSRSQPDLHAQYNQTAGDAPGMPPMPRNGPNANDPNASPMGLANGGPRGRGPPPRGMTVDSGTGRGVRPGPGGPGYGPPPGQPLNLDPRFARGQQQPPLPRGYSDDTTYSEPGPQAMRNGSPMAPGGSIRRPGTAAPAAGGPGRMPSDPVNRPGTAQPQNSNPDALPAHPAPVRAGLMQGTQQQGQPPAPVRNYAPNQSRSAPPPQHQRQPSVAHPVTHDELNRLRNTWRANPNDGANALQLAKKLVEAATVLADEGGTADTRTRNKNREKYIMEGHKIVKKLVSNSNPDAMFYLADAYGQGSLGLQVDTKEAFTLYQSAAKLGHPASAYRTAVCCEMGNEEGGGTRRDYIKAVQWYKRAAALGDTPAMYKVGMILLKGLLGQQKNMGEAINMLKRAADRADAENPHALHELGLLYEAQTGNERIIRDEPYAYSLFMQAAELGYKFSQFRLGQAYEYGLLGCQIDARSSLAWYTRAAAQEEHQSELALSGWYLTGSQGILEQSDTEAYLWARKAACAEPPLPKALFAMGYFTEVGIGCPRSLEEAKRWYGRAATYKFPKAQERLEELKRGGSKAQKSRERLSRSNQKQHEENCVVM